MYMYIPSTTEVRCLREQATGDGGQLSTLHTNKMTTNDIYIYIHTCYT